MTFAGPKSSANSPLVLCKSWINNSCAEVTDSVSNITLKQQKKMKVR